VKQVLERLTERQVPGLAVVVIRDGELVPATAGVADLRTAGPMTPDTACLWFSMTKIVTATAVMQLAERGALSLGEAVRSFVPDFPEPRSGWPEVTVRHLLSHSAGLGNPIPVRWVHRADTQGRDPSEFAAELLRRNRKLRFPAGSKAVYSNLGYIVLGEVIGAAAGRRFEDHVRAEILEPLGMSRTGFAYPADDDVAPGYQSRRSPMTPLFRLLLPKGIIGPAQGRFVAFERFYVDGPAYGGLVGSAADAARFMAIHLGDGGGIVSPESVRVMQTIHASGRGIDVGYGWFRRGKDRTGGERYLEHLGGGGGFWNVMRIYPDRRLGVLAMGNVTSWDHEQVAASALA
jgi:CubicO group peptidase (beta-lactamase class C family)